MKRIVIVFLWCSQLLVAQHQTAPSEWKKNSKSIESLTQDGAIRGLLYANELADAMHKKIAVVFLDVSGSPILMTIGTGVGPHNLEAARRKAYTALSTKTATLDLARNAKANPYTENLNTLPELLLLGGGVPIRVNATIIGSVGIAGAGGAVEDDAIAKQIVTLFLL